MKNKKEKIENWIPNCKLKCGIEVQIFSIEGKKKAPKVKCECGQDIMFAKTRKGNWMPIQLVGFAEYDTHYAYCPLAEKFRKKNKSQLKDEK